MTGSPGPDLSNTGSGAIATGTAAAAGAGGAAATSGGTAQVFNGPVYLVPRSDGAGTEAQVLANLPVATRRTPVLPRRPRECLGREISLDRLGTVVREPTIAAVSGLAGAGKSTLLAELAHSVAPGIPDGVVYVETVPGPGRLDDLVQDIHDRLWDTSPTSRKVTIASAPGLLKGIRAVVIVDGPELSADEVRILGDVVPDSPLIVATTAPLLGGQLELEVVGPLPRDASIRLLASRAHADPTTAVTTFDEAAQLLGDWPGALVTIGQLIGAGRVTLPEAITIMSGASTTERSGSAAAYERVRAVIETTLSAEERATLDVAADLATPSASRTMVARVAAERGTPAPLDDLERTGLVWSNSPRLRMDPGLREALVADAARSGRPSALQLLAAKPELLLEEGALEDDDAVAALRALDSAREGGMHRSVLDLAGLLDPVLVRRGRWDALGSALAAAAASARAGDDQAGLAWALHEEGTRLLGLRAIEPARATLTEALVIRRHLGDPIAIERTQHNLAVLQSVPPLPPNDAPGSGPGSTPVPPRPPVSGTLLAMIAVVAALAILAVTFAVGVWPPTPVPSPTEVPSSQPSASIAQSTPTVTPSFLPTLGVIIDFETLDVGATGEWTGSVVVTPTGGAAPYTIRSKDDVQRTVKQGSAWFPVGNLECAAVGFGATVESGDGQGYDVDGTFGPDRCADFVRPPAPDIGDPGDGYELLSNCAHRPLALGGSPAPNTPAGSTWTFEVESLEAETWTPMRSVSGLKEPVLRMEFPCGTSYRWRLATVSLSGWQSEFSKWSMFAIRPTAIPVLVPAGPGSCVLPWPLSWTVDRMDGISSYVIQVVDVKGDPVSVRVAGATATVDGDCSTDYQWRGSSIDSEGNPGRFSEWTPFSIATPIF